MDVSLLKVRVDALLALPFGPARGVESIQRANELLQGALTVMEAVYGPQSNQLVSLLKAAEEVRNRKTGHLGHNIFDLILAVRGVLENLKAELEGGLIGSLQRRLSGEVLTDFLQLARTVLDEPGDDAKNVAAVLAAAAFEDTIRRMAAAFAGVIGRDDLSKVIDALKQQGVLQPPQLGIALSYLNFRNRSLHAEWNQIDRASVNSVLGFVEQLLLKHFQ